MFKTTLTLSEPMAKTLRLYPVKPKGNMHAQSQVVEEAFIEFFKRHRITVENLTTVKKISPDEAKNKIVLIIKRCISKIFQNQCFCIFKDFICYYLQRGIQYIRHNM